MTGNKETAVARLDRLPSSLAHRSASRVGNGNTRSHTTRTPRESKKQIDTSQTSEQTHTWSTVLVLVEQTKKVSTERRRREILISFCVRSSSSQMATQYVLRIRLNGAGQSLVERTPVVSNTNTGLYEVAAAAAAAAASTTRPRPPPCTDVDQQRIGHLINTRPDLQALRLAFLRIHPHPILFYEWYSMNTWLDPSFGNAVSFDFLGAILRHPYTPTVDWIRMWAFTAHDRKRTATAARN